MPREPHTFGEPFFVLRGGNERVLVGHWEEGVAGREGAEVETATTADTATAKRRKNVESFQVLSKIMALVFRRRWPKNGKIGHARCRIDLDQQTDRGRRNRFGFGQPSSCSSPRAVLEACHGPSPQCSASRLQRTAPAATTQSSAASSASARSVKSSSCRTWSRRARRG